MTTGTGVNDGQGHSLPDGAGVAPDFDALWRDAISALRDLGRQVRALREQVEER